MKNRWSKGGEREPDVLEHHTKGAITERRNSVREY